ncbi:MAG: RNase J family beta-CASP ribonuclease [Candidatus Nanohaloarchaeota archaeon QJJ-9]|nr:RNase J family beta-CASP ribonuclease [Candidatus Nanohaloarchaeota archaeon QJJ-9]
MKIYTIGGYEEVGKNMTAIEVNDEIVILDMGYDMEAVIEEDNEIEEMTTKDTIKAGAIPKDKEIHQKSDKVKAIVVGHGHLDHVGGVPKLAGSYDCPVISTPYTKKIIQRMVREDRKDLNNELVEMNTGERRKVSENIEIEFVNITHSIPQATMIVLHTPEGKVAYSLDYRLDKEPLLGDKPDYERMNELGEEGVKLFIGDSTRIDEEGAGSSEKTVKTELKHTLNQAYNEGGGVFVTTFSSHIERLNSIIDVNNGRRKIAFIGRSLKEYTESGEEIDLIDLSNIEVASYHNEVEDLMSKISRNKEDWLVVCTGNQGEPRSVLKRIATGDYPLEIKEGDHVIFSSSVIPSPVNRANRYKLEKVLKEKGARQYKDIHISGHALREDNRDMLRMLKPDNILPAHGDTEMLASYAKLAMEEGYDLNDNLFICQNGNVLEI